jgi:hypothetical protein
VQQSGFDDVDGVALRQRVGHSENALELAAEIRVAHAG